MFGRIPITVIILPTLLPRASGWPLAGIRWHLTSRTTNATPPSRSNKVPPSIDHDDDDHCRDGPAAAQPASSARRVGVLTCLRTRMGDFSPRNGAVAFFAEPFFFAPSAAAVALPLRARSATWQSERRERERHDEHTARNINVCVCVSGG